MLKATLIQDTDTMLTILEYALKFDGKLGEKHTYTGRILGVGIAYDKETKAHSCKIEVLRAAV